LDYWEAWVKPLYVLNSPFQKTFWIDCDTVITGNLNQIIDDQSIFTADHTGVNEGTYNQDQLYQLLPIGLDKDSGPYLNTGVFIIDKTNDKELIDTWIDCVVKASQNPAIAASIMCWDQGACKWALQKTGLIHLINNTKAFNFPATSRQFIFPSTPTAMNIFLHTIKVAISDKVVVYHWMGSPKPWKKWGDLLDVRIESMLQ
jgi:lipopolysaccharide biosynthesis glycosyltransferase